MAAMIGEAEVVVGAEVDDLLVARAHEAALGGGEDALGLE